ncbi:MAG: hypothetical protein B5M53_05525 [Candidatus Cloacimonas sp. 4484_209]|nr:MAG: hypothetical protein B5M53_05525 [Candidatus Cloacimonas sp. 4484_209]
MKNKKEKKKEKVEKLLKSKGLFIRHLDKDWFWVKNRVIEKYGKEIGVYGVAIYCTLSMFADRNTAYTFISQKKIAELLNISRRIVISTLAKLEELNLIYKLHREGRKTNVYILTGGTRLKKIQNPDGSVEFIPPELL